MQVKTVVLAVALSVAPGLLHAQFDFKIDGRDVQIHSFGSQSFAYSNGNNYLTMKTSQGNFGFTDAGMNVSSQITDKFRVGAQVYVLQLGDLAKGQVTLDWAVAGYRFKDWFSIRAGKVKTVLGLYNDTQDIDFLNTWALLPQSMYPLDLRSSTIAHIGGDFYGTISLRRLGSASYTAYAGMRPDNSHDGYRYFLRDKIPLDSYTGPLGGGDLRWNTPIKGILVGASFLTQHPGGSGTALMGPTGGAGGRYHQESKKNQISQFYVQYTLGGLRIDGEYRRDYRDQTMQMAGNTSDILWDARSWYISGAYRICKRLEIGSYYSRFVPDWSKDPSPPGNHIYDKVVSARFDLTKFWTVKVEGHFIDGYGAMDSARGFYDFGSSTVLGAISATMKPKTNLLMIRTGFSF